MVTANFGGNPASTFAVSAVTPEDDQIDVDAGLNFQTSPNFALFAGYQGTFRNDLDSHGFSAGLSYSFGDRLRLRRRPPRRRRLLLPAASPAASAGGALQPRAVHRVLRLG